MNRRNFLKITFAAGVASALPFALPANPDLPVIIGDGVHDDTEGLAAAFEGRDFIARNDCVKVVGGCVYLAAGEFRITRLRGRPNIIGAGKRTRVRLTA